ncbi:MAG: ABC transporter permease [Acidobacteria bacterium]|nr:ABC transporter permease [Acidobacteriota bacterium]
MLIDEGTAILRDTRAAIRSLLRAPGFTLVAILTLGLGIGANTSMFSLLNEVMLRPLPYADNDRLDRIVRSTEQEVSGGFSPADTLDAASGFGGYGEIAAYGTAQLSLAEPGRPAEMAPALRVSANFLSLLGVEPQLGRGFVPKEAVRGNHRVLVISQRAWQNRFGGRSDIVGHTVRVDGEVHEIVGVLPASFNDWRHLGWVDLLRPLGLDEKEIADRSGTWLELIGKRSAGITREEGEAFVTGFGSRLAKAHPEVHAKSVWRSTPLSAAAAGDNGPTTLAMLIGLSGFVLLIACSNLANLLLARTMARAREFAVRTALGASRTRLLRPLFLESLLLALTGGAFAVYVAVLVADWLAVRSTGDNGERVVLALDWHVLSWTFGACLFTAVVFGVAPALFTLRLDPNGTLKGGGRGTTSDRGHQRFRQFLIVGQFALAMVLLAGAALFARGLHEINNRRQGWESNNLVTGRMLLPAGAYPDATAISEFQRLTVERLEALPGVASVSVSYSMPFFGLSEPRSYVVEGRVTEPGREPAAHINGVSPRYFETVGTRIFMGRAFSTRDTLDSPKVFIINQAMAQGLFGKESPLGRKIARAGGKSLEWGEVVGVAADVQSVYPNPGPVKYQLYQPLAQEPRPLCEIAVRTAGVAPATVVDGIRTAMTALDADLPVRRLQPAGATIARANYQLGVLSSMLSSIALLGLGLASLGIYGVIARTMAQRTGEFGIRLALGAQVRDITRLVLASGAKLAFLGSAIGLAGAYGISRLLNAAWEGMQMNSGLVLTGATLVLTSIALLACYIPARSASRLNPTEILRSE